jgi:membrane associated rhomboid family serine protease
MLNGEPWRAVTALTLHVDVAHVVGNAIATAVLLPAIVQRLGPGGGVWLVLLAGTGANLLAATAQGSRHVAVGASTATFGAIGALAALRLWPGSAPGRTRGKRWIVPVATVLLLAMLGTGRSTDVLAHAFGLLSGGLLGLVVAVSRRPLVAPIQWALVAAAALTIVGCWHLALSGTLGY